VTALIIALLAASASPPLEIAVVRDPELTPLEPELVSAALRHAEEQFRIRFGVEGPRFVVTGHLVLSQFLGKYSLPTDPVCRPLYEARYRGGGAKELSRRKKQALEFFQKWPLESLIGFAGEAASGGIRTYEDIFDIYVDRYTRTVDAMRELKTQAGTPLVEPEKWDLRSFAAWTCALARQQDYDVVITNAFILADLMDEPHPHAVFGKAKVGGIATRSPARSALGGQALLATTFGIDTKLPQFRELPEGPVTLEERAKILGAYLLAHELAHAIYGIPDVFDHPKGCLMTSRPGVSYREGLAELEANPAACPRCRPYVEAEALGDQARDALAEKKHQRAHDLVAQSLKKLPKHVHGGRKKRVADLLLVAADASKGLGRASQARKYRELAIKLDPTLTSSTSTVAR
jgi:hypothetical protein